VQLLQCAALKLRYFDSVDIWLSLDWLGGVSHSEADLLFVKILRVPGVNTELFDRAELLGFDHLDTIALLVDQEAVLFAFDDLGMLVSLSQFFILFHLRV